MVKSDSADAIPGLDPSYIPAACIGRNARGPLTHHQIHIKSQGGSLENIEMSAAPWFGYICQNTYRVTQAIKNRLHNQNP